MSEVGSAYGGALYSLAQDEKASADILRQLDALDAGFQQAPDYLGLLGSPNLSKQERCRILDECFRGWVHTYVLNFLKILTEKGAISHFSACCAVYRKRYNQDNGILPATAVTATPLSDAQKRKLTDTLSRRTGKTIELACRIDASILGGMRLDYDGKQLDDTVAHRLGTIRSLLENTVLF